MLGERDQEVSVTSYNDASFGRMSDSYTRIIQPPEPQLSPRATCGVYHKILWPHHCLTCVISINLMLSMQSATSLLVGDEDEGQNRFIACW